MNVLFSEAAVVLIAAPLAGVGMGSPLRVLAVLGGSIACGAALIAAVAGVDVLGSLALSQLTLLAAAVALAAVGRMWRAIFADVLDAAALTLASVLALTLGVLAAGPLSSDLPTPALNFLLGVNPLIAVMSAAGVDILRSELLYRLSPIAHRQFEYPAWSFSFGLFCVTAAIAFVITAAARRRFATESSSFQT